MIRRLVPADVAEYRRLRLAALREAPMAFGRSYAEESLQDLSFFTTRLENTADQWTLGAFAGRRLVGNITLGRDQTVKSRHKAVVYGMYVAPRWRKRGTGRELMAHLIEVARTLEGLKLLRLGVVSSNRPALKLYTQAGFRTYGEEPMALFVNGRYHPEKLMALTLKASRRQPSPRVKAQPGKRRSAAVQQ